MVATNEGAAGAGADMEAGTVLSKVRQTLSSGLMNAQHQVTRNLGPAGRQDGTSSPDSAAAKTEEIVTTKPSKPEAPRVGACRVCLKGFKEGDFSRVCSECHQKVCEDCASYYKQDENQDENVWWCSICRRKLQSRTQPVLPQDSTESMLDVPVLEALQRRHSDVKIGSSSLVVAGGTALAPPRSPELRRHSDVSPASLKEIEKVKEKRAREQMWRYRHGNSAGSSRANSPIARERDLEWLQSHGRSPRHSRAPSPSAREMEQLQRQRRSPGSSRAPSPSAREKELELLYRRGRSPGSSRATSPIARERELEWRHKRGSPGNSRATSPSVERRPFVGEETRWDPQRPQRDKPPTAGDDAEPDDPNDPWRLGAGRGGTAASRVRRKSRVQKQHSYDDDVKAGAAANPGSGVDPALGLPAALPRRASAYDVFMARGDGTSVNPATLASAPATASGRRASCRGAPPLEPEEPSSGRRASCRGAPPLEPEEPPGGRRPSCRGAPPPEPDESSGSRPISPETNPALAVEEDRRNRRRGSQLPDIAAISRGTMPPTVRSPSRTDEHAPEVRRQASVQDGEAIKIVIHDVDYEPILSSRPGTKRRLSLRRDHTDKAHRTRGFGMRVVGGKVGADGRLFAYIVWTVPGGPAEKGGLQQGDKVLEWGGVPLTDRSFDDVCTIMDHTGDTVELLVEHGVDLRMCDLLDEPMPVSARKNSGEGLGLQLETESDKSPASPTRRKLPKTPEQLAREKQVSGRIQLQAFYHDEKNELVVSVFAADDLAPREDTGYGTLPEAYVQLRLLPLSADQSAVKTEVAGPTQSPIWNTTLEIKNVTGEQLMDKTIEVTLWDSRPDKEQVFLGECSVDLTKSLIEDCPVWYRLEDPRQIRTGKPSPRSSLVNEINARLLARGNRSVSEDRESDDGELVGSYLHPDHAYMSGSRRGSSQSEQLEVETYQLSQDFSRSLPGSRRSSFQKEGEKQEAEQPMPVHNRDRRRSSVTPRKDPDEILRSLRAVKGELLGRSMSISVDKRGQRHSGGGGKDGLGRKGSMMVGMERTERLVSCSSPSDEEDKWGTKGETKPLGPGQIQPRGHRSARGGQAELKLGLLMTKGQLEVEVICARGITGDPPDTYVKTYLRDGERWLQKRKTRVVRHSIEPEFRQTLRYSACDVLGRTLVVMLWEKQKGFEHNVGLGGAEIAFNRIKLTQTTLGWYPLYPIQTLGSDSNDSP